MTDAIFSAMFDQVAVGQDSDSLAKSITTGSVIEQHTFPPLNIPDANRMKFAGWASTRDVDFQNESIDPKFMDLSYISRNGMKIKWEHGHPAFTEAGMAIARKMPGAVVGHCTDVSKYDYGLFVKGEMYQSDDPTSPISLARKSLELNLQGGNPVKLSIEGTYGKSLASGVRETVPTSAVFTYEPVNPASVVMVYKSLLAKGCAPTYETDSAKKDGADVLVGGKKKRKGKKIVETDMVGKSLISICEDADEASYILERLRDEFEIIDRGVFQKAVETIQAVNQFFKH